MATKEAKALLLTAGTVFLSAAVAMASITPPNYIAAGILERLDLALSTSERSPRKRGKPSKTSSRGKVASKMQEYITLIQGVGFPAAAFILMYWLVRDSLKEMRDSLNENTKAITAMYTVLQKHVEEKDRLIRYLERGEREPLAE